MKRLWWLKVVASCILLVGIWAGANSMTRSSYIAFWSKNRTRYERVVEQCRSVKASNGIGLDRASYDLAIDHTAWIDRDRVFRVKLLVFRWAIDNSYGIVYQEPASPLPESDPLFEVWGRTTKLADGWYLVEGT